MTRALIVTGYDPAAPSMFETARLDQIVALLHGLGRGVDLLSIHNSENPNSAPPQWPAGIDNIAFARLPAHDLARPENCAALNACVQGFVEDDGYCAVVQCGLDLPEAFLPGVFRIFDARDGDAWSWPTNRVDVLLAAIEQVRAQSAYQGDLSARWPLAMTAPAIAPARHGLIGWPGTVDATLAHAWSGVLERMVERRITPPGGLMLDARVKVLPLLARARVDGAGFAQPAQARALSLGLFPGEDPTRYLWQIQTLIARGVPVLMSKRAADRFEGRWRLPVSEDANGLLDWVHGWTDGRDVTGLRTAALETAQVFREDSDAMTAFVRNQLDERLRGR